MTTKAKTQSTTVTMPIVSTVRHPASSYPRLQQCRRISGIPKLRTRKGELADGTENYWITYTSADGKQHEAQSLDEWSTILAEAIAAKADMWTPDTSVVHLTELISSCAFCDSAIVIDISKLKSARIPDKIAHLVVIADVHGFALDKAGQIVNISELLAAVAAGERLGMAFAKV